MQRIAVLTSGGDAPGMNAAIRAVTRVALDKDWEVLGVRGGYAGLIAGELVNLEQRSVGGIIQQGGTVLGSARCPELRTPEGQQKALENLRARGVEGLVVIGGNGSQMGAHALWHLGLPVAGVASTIDNDLYGSEITIGVDTALNIALESVDRLKVTASSHKRAFLVEVMGRDCGYLALMVGIAGGAEAVVIPEREIDPDALSSELRLCYHRGKAHAIVVVAEGSTYNADRLVRYFREHRERVGGFELRATILGHVQRGGSPGAFDRLLATRFGAAAVQRLAQGEHGVLIGLNKGDLTTTPLDVVGANKKPLDLRLFERANALAK